MTRKWILLSGAIIFWCWCAFRPISKIPACVFTAFDVGQGDSLLIQTSDHQDILIDGGPDTSVVEKLGQALPPGDRDLELVVLTHPHADHVNGLIEVTRRFTVRRALLTGLDFNQAAYQEWRTELSAQHIPTITAVAGQSYQLGRAVFDVLWPAQSLASTAIVHDVAANGGGVNDSSIVLRLSCGGSAAMLMGDASSEIEERMINSGTNIQAALLKVGHHGSRFSSSPIFLRQVQPRWAVISAGVGNRYHHPHPTTLLHLERSGAMILRTDRAGDIRLVTDGHGGWDHPH